MLLSEMFGVKRDVKFEVIGYIGKFMIREWSDGTERLCWGLKENKVYVNADLEVLYYVLLKAPANIIHLPPPLTDEQREQLKALWTLGGRWLVMDSDMAVNTFVDKPVKHELQWTGNEYFAVCATLIVSSLVSWSDNEPYDIGKALGVGE